MDQVIGISFTIHSSTWISPAKGNSLRGRLAILTYGESTETEAYANSDMAKIEKWAKLNKMKFNERKSKTMLIAFTAPLGEDEESKFPFEITSMDITGPYVSTPRKNKYLVTFIDNFTRYVGDPKSKVSNFFRNRKKHIFSIIDTSF